MCPSMEGSKTVSKVNAWFAESMLAGNTTAAPNPELVPHSMMQLGLVSKACCRAGSTACCQQMLATEEMTGRLTERNCLVPASEALDTHVWHPISILVSGLHTCNKGCGKLSCCTVSLYLVTCVAISVSSDVVQLWIWLWISPVIALCELIS